MYFFVQPQAQLTEEDKAQDASMRDAFRKISGEDMEIDAYELQDIINAAFMKGTKGRCTLSRFGKISDSFVELTSSLRYLTKAFTLACNCFLLKC